MIKFKIGDKVKIKPVSEYIFNTHSLFKNEDSYLSYCVFISRYTKLKTGKIISIILDKLDDYSICVLWETEDQKDKFYFYSEELEKVYDIKTKINFVKDLIKK